MLLGHFPMLRVSAGRSVGRQEEALTPDADSRRYSAQEREAEEWETRALE